MAHAAEEPQLKYEPLLGDVPALIARKERITALCLSDKILALGSDTGVVYILDYSGNQVRSWRTDRAAGIVQCTRAQCRSYSHGSAVARAQQTPVPHTGCVFASYASLRISASSTAAGLRRKAELRHRGPFSECSHARAFARRSSAYSSTVVPSWTSASTQLASTLRAAARTT